MNTTSAVQDDLRYRRIELNSGASMPGLGFGTLISDPALTKDATRVALEAGFRALDCAERYRNEREVGEGLREVLEQKAVRRGDVFVVSKLWNNNHRPERVRPALEATLSRLQLEYLDLYLVHTPFAFRPGDDQEPRDEKGNLVYDKGISLIDTWRALESLVTAGRCRAIGLSDVSVAQVEQVLQSAKVRPAVVQVESHPYLPEWEMFDLCKKNGIAVLAFAPLGHGIKPGPLEDPVITKIARRVGKSPAQVLLAWGIQRGTAVLTTPKTASRARENFDISRLPDDAMAEIRGITIRSRLNPVVETGLPGFIPRKAEHNGGPTER